MIMTYPEIPLDAGQIQGWENIIIRDDGLSDELVPLGLLSPGVGNLMTSSIYFGEHTNSPYTSANRLEGSLLTLFVRRSVAERLSVAEQLLPVGHHLILFDAYRPYQVQRSLYNFYVQKLKELHQNADRKSFETEAKKYVSLPSVDPTRPAPHSTGGVVDLAIVKLNRRHEEELVRIRARLSDDHLDAAEKIGLELRASATVRHHAKMLDFGTAFDHGGERSALTYYEAKIAAGETLSLKDVEACNNRRLLFDVMSQAGFQPYAAEWWHFDAPETQWGAAAAGLDYATFGSIALSKANRAHENRRLSVRQAALELLREGGGAAGLSPLYAEIHAAIQETGDIRLAGDWPTEVIAPNGV